MNYEVKWITKNFAQLRMFVIDDMLTNCFAYRGGYRNYIIDTGFGSDASEILKELIDSEKPTIVINTHYHWDHIWGNAFFEEILLIGHKNINKKINEYWDKMLSENERFVTGITKKVLPDITFTDSLRFEDDCVELIYTPGHSDDSISCFLEKEKILIAGDNIGDNEQEIFPYIDNDLQTLRGSLECYLRLKPDIVASGHHQVTSIKTIENIYKICCEKISKLDY